MLPQAGTDLLWIRVARELAIEHHPLGDILQRYGIDSDVWACMSTDRRFTDVLKGEIEAWQSATNTHERSKLKAAAIIEEWLQEAHMRMHDPKEGLPAKTEVAKLITRIAGMGITGTEYNGMVGEKFVVNINLGADKQLTFAKDIVTPRGNKEAIEGGSDGSY